MLTGLKDVLSMFWTRIRRVESWVYGLSQSPMIIEEETEGIWRYRKWNNGVAECWGIYTATLTHYAASVGGASSQYGYNTGTLNFPVGLFIESPITNCSAVVGNGFASTGTLTLSGLTKDSCVYYAVCTTNGSQSTSWYIYAIGNWKTPTNVTTTLNGNYYTDDVWNYNFLINKPSINDIILIGNKTSADLGIANQSDVDYIRSRLQAITTEGGEPNAIDSISVNGVATTPDINKNVSLTIPNISISTSAPTILDGANGDIWFVYEASETGE